MEEIYKLMRAVYAAQLNPEKYGSVETHEQLDYLLEQNPEDKAASEQALKDRGEEGLMSDAKKLYEQSIASKASGGKLAYADKLKKYKKGTKCKCGCELVFAKEAGGKVTKKCACGCEAKK
jgi:hypothetical protein